MDEWLFSKIRNSVDSWQQLGTSNVKTLFRHGNGWMRGFGEPVEQEWQARLPNGTRGEGAGAIEPDMVTRPLVKRERRQTLPRSDGRNSPVSRAPGGPNEIAGPAAAAARIPAR